MRIPAALLLAALISGVAAAHAQTSPTGNFEVRTTRGIPAGKIAVDLSPDSELGRDLRRLVMEKLAKTGHEVGFSGGHILKLQVNLQRGLSTSPGGRGADDQIDRRTGIDAQRPTPQGPARAFEPPRPGGARNDLLSISMTIHGLQSRELLWSANASCRVGANDAFGAGRNMIDNIFAQPNASRKGEADCPI
jgi:hypothetical protein